ncbi:PORIM protein, partial [Polypterus senegalus]
MTGTGSRCGLMTVQEHYKSEMLKPFTYGSAYQDNNQTITTNNATLAPTAKSGNSTVSGTASSHIGSRFDGGSFIGGILLTLGMTTLLFLAYKFSYARREVQYRTL